MFLKNLQRIVFTLILYITPFFVCAQQVYKVYTEEFPPYNYTENGQLIGQNVDIVNELFERLAFTPEFVVLPWARGYLHALTTPNALIFSMARNTEREPLFKWVGSLGGINNCMFSLSSNDNFNLSTLEDAKKYTVVTQLNGNFNVLLEKAGFKSGKNLFLSVSVESSVKMLQTGRVDLIALPRHVIFHYLKSQGKSLESKIKSQICIESTALYLAFNKNTPDDIVDMFRIELENLKKEQ